MLKRLLIAAALCVAVSAPAFSQSGQFPAGTVQGNASAAKRQGQPETVTAILDRALGSTRGALIERGSTGWGLIGPGTVGKPLVSGGAGADPAYQTLGIAGGGTNCAAASGTCLDNITGFAGTGPIIRTGAGAYTFLTPTRAGDIIYWNGTAWVTLAGNNSGSQVLSENASGVPAWTAAGPGGSSGQIQYNNNGAFGGFTASGDVAINTTSGAATIQPSAVTNVKLNPGAANTVKGSLNGSTTSDLAIASCSALYNFTQWVIGTGWQCGINPVLPSRAVAATLNLSAFSVVTTQGYASPGDGGGAMFKNVGSAAFIDAGIATGSITNAGASCTNGTYMAVPLTGGNGTNAQATIVVSGNIVTSLTITQVGNAYHVSDVLSVAASTLGTCTGFAWTVATIQTPTGSFTDSAGTHWQIISDANNFPNIKQFGAACNWTKSGGDGAATNDTTTVQNALNYTAAILPPTIDGGGLAGGTLILPKCYSLVGALVVPFGVRFIGQGPQSSGLKEADSLPATSHFITICDPTNSTSHLACFGSYLGNMTLFPGSGVANSNIAMIYSNNIQQATVLGSLWIYSGPRACIFFEQGFGGAAQVDMTDIECTISNTTSNAGIQFNYGTTLINMRNINVESGGSGATANGIQILGGHVDLVTYHTEGVSNGIFLNVPANTGISGFHNLSGGSHCTNLIVRQAASSANVNVAGRLTANGCTNTINNAGSITSGDVVADTTF